MGSGLGNVENCERIDREDEQLDHKFRPEERRLGDMVSRYTLQQRRNRRLTLAISGASVGLAVHAAAGLGAIVC